MKKYLIKIDRMNSTLQYTENLETKESIIAALRKREIDFYSLQDHQKNDKKIVLESIKIEPWNFIYLCALLKNNPKIIRFALKMNIHLICQISKRLIHQKTIIIFAKQYDKAISSAYHKNNRAFIIYQKRNKDWLSNKTLSIL